jgi:translation initiation factor IF-2
VTDIVVLVVAADDGVKPQTVEAINHAKAAKVPMIVAINKIDKQGADPQRVRTELLSHEIVVESLGRRHARDRSLGAEEDRTRQGCSRRSPCRPRCSSLPPIRTVPPRASSSKPSSSAAVARSAPALVQRGTLRLGDLIVAGSAYGRVRALINDLGEQVKEAGPSVPVEVLGFDSAPEAGDQFAVVENEARAREITDYRLRERRKRLAVAGQRGSLEQMMTQLKSAGTKEFTLLVKGDVQGSVEAIVAALDKLGTDEVRARIIHYGVGGITESDVGLASTSGAVILGFNVRTNAQAREHAERDGVEIRYYAVIYDLVDEVKQAMSGLLAPTRRETFLGNAEILEVFTISKVGKVAGCRVTEGKVERGAHVRLIRDNVVVHEGKLSTLKRFKDEVKEGRCRPGMRHGVRRLSGHAPGRRHRVLRGRARQAHAVRPLKSSGLRYCHDRSQQG